MAFFARVVEARSFSAAARSLGVSKSAVSARVARLERRLGVQLLHRTTRRLALTADGVRLHERCARVLAEADQAAELAAGASASPRGTLRVHAPPALARAHLTTLIGGFLAAHPSVQVELHLSDRTPDAGAHGIDVSIAVASRLADSGLVARKLATARVAACAAPAYLRRKGIPFRPQDLVLHDCLAHSLLDEDWLFLTDEGPVAMARSARLSADDSAYVREAALAGLGVAMLPETLVSDDLAAGRLRRVLDDYQTVELTVYALHPHGRLPSASVRAFLDHLAAGLRRPPWLAAREAPAPPLPPRPRGRRPVPMTEQDVRRLGAVAALHDEVLPEATEQLRRVLAGVKVMRAARIPRTTATMNSRVRLRGAAGEEREVSLVYPWDEARDRVSVLDPLGLRLLGASVGDAVTDGARPLTLAAIPYQPEAAGDHNL